MPSDTGVLCAPNERRTRGAWPDEFIQDDGLERRARGLSGD